MDPYFDAVTAELRGFDLGDDDELLGKLVRRRAQEADSLEFSDWMLLGVLMHRAGAEAQAFDCFEQASGARTNIPLPRYLQAQLSLDRGEADEAEALLDIAEEANEDTLLVPPAELIHARGSLALARGIVDDALALYATALKHDATNGARWLDLANLCRVMGRSEDAYEAALEAVRLHPKLEPAVYALACAAAEADKPEAALEALGNAFVLDPSRRPHALDDAALDPLRELPGFAKLFAENEPDLDWLDAFPTWFQMLRADPALTELGVSWLDAGQSEEQTNLISAGYESRGPAGILHTEATLALSRELLQHRRVVAKGPSVRRRDGTEEPSWLLVDTADPQQLWIALSSAYPPFLWLDAGAAVQSVRETLAEYYPRPARDRSSLPLRARGFMGYRGRFGVGSPYSADVAPAEREELDHHFAISPFLEPGSWGGAYADDPWPDDVPLQPNSPVLFGRRQREVNKQTTGAVWSLTRRTRHSRSYLGMELHHQEVFVADVRYAPSRQHGVVRRMNRHFGCDYPVDLPVDTIAALLGFSFDSAVDLQTELECTANPEELAGILSLLSALRHSDLSTVPLYQRYMDHPDPVVRTTLWNIFAAYNFEWLLEEALLVEEDPEILQQLTTLLSTGVPAVEHEALAEATAGDKA